MLSHTLVGICKLIHAEITVIPCNADVMTLRHKHTEAKRQYGRHFPDDIFRWKLICFDENIIDICSPGSS